MGGGGVPASFIMTREDFEKKKKKYKDITFYCPQNADSDEVRKDIMSILEKNKRVLIK